MLRTVAHLWLPYLLILPAILPYYPVPVVTMTHGGVNSGIDMHIWYVMSMI
jgi:hypothetical protein